jgi:hypothetical protein
MAKSKKAKNKTAGRPKLPAAFLEEILSCENGHELVLYHLSIDPSTVLLGIVAIMLNTESPYRLPSDEDPPEPVLDYLEESLSIVGLPQISMCVKSDYYRAVLMFFQTCQTVDLDKLTDNARIYDLLLAK